MSERSTEVSETRRPRPHGLLGTRRRFLVPGYGQKRSILGVVALAFILLATLDYTLYALQQDRAEKALAVAPELEKMIGGQDRLEMWLILASSGAALLAVAALALFESHKSAGPLYNLTQTMKRFGRQEEPAHVRFRKDDHYREVEDAYNAMVGQLVARAEERVVEAGRIAAELRRIAEDPAVVGGRESLSKLAIEFERLKGSLARP